MKKLHWFYEPESRDRYVKDEVPWVPLLPFSEYKRLPDFTPPAIWSYFTVGDERWDPLFLKIRGDEYAKNREVDPTGLIPITVQLKMFAKSYAWKQNPEQPGVKGTVFWTLFPRVPHCWVVIESYQESYKMVTEKEFGVLHDRSPVVAPV